MRPRLRIGVAGAGMGGLAAAALLAGRGHDVTVYDRFETPRPVGSGLVIQPVGQDVLKAVGALPSAMRKGNPVKRMLGYEVEARRRVLDVQYERNGDGRFGLAIHRAALFDALMEAANAAGARLETRSEVACVDRGRLVFADGRKSDPHDLIVDATGAGSALSPIRCRALSYGAVWSTVDWPDETALPFDQLSQRYRRADRMVGVLPIGHVPGEDGRKAAIFWSLPAEGYSDWLSGGLGAWRDEASRLWPDFAPFAEQITDPDQMVMARYPHGTLIKPYGDGIAHIGDAAHRASPQLGQGANMALLDAMALAEALEREPVDIALLHYARARRWHVWVYQAMSAAFTPQYQSDSRVQPWLRDRLLFPLSQVTPVPRLLTAIVCGTMIPPLGSLQRQ